MPLACIVDNVYKDILTARLNEQRKEGKFCDVNLKIWGQTLPIHSSVLSACSPYFRQLNLGEYPASGSLLEIYVPSDKSPDESSDMVPEVIADLLDYIYTGRIQLKEETVETVVMLAETFALEGLVALIKTYVNKSESPVTLTIAMTESTRHSQSIDDAKAEVGQQKGACLRQRRQRKKSIVKNNLNRNTSPRDSAINSTKPSRTKPESDVPTRTEPRILRTRKRTAPIAVNNDGIGDSDDDESNRIGDGETENENDNLNRNKSSPRKSATDLTKPSRTKPKSDVPSRTEPRILRTMKRTAPIAVNNDGISDSDDDESNKIGDDETNNENESNRIGGDETKNEKESNKIGDDKTNNENENESNKIGDAETNNEKESNKIGDAETDHQKESNKIGDDKTNNENENESNKIGDDETKNENEKEPKPKRARATDTISSNRKSPPKKKTSFRTSRANGADATFNCKHCDFVSSEPAEIRRHKLLHPGSSTFVCLTCSYVTRSVDKLLSHLRCDSDDHNSVTTCSVCGAETIDREDYLKHLSRHDDPKPFFCHCDARFATRWFLKVHARKHNTSRPHVCEVCDRRFKSKDSLRAHGKIHSKTHGVRRFVCSDCDFRTAYKHNLQMHERIHTGNLVPCPVAGCTRRSNTMKGIQAHLILHSKTRPYHCEECGAKFSHPSNLRQHRKLHDLDASTLRCERCDFTTLRPDRLRYHTTKVHGSSEQVD